MSKFDIFGGKFSHLKWVVFCIVRQLSEAEKGDGSDFNGTPKIVGVCAVLVMFANLASHMPDKRHGVSESILGLFHSEMPQVMKQKVTLFLFTGRMGWMAHRRWKETKQQPGTAGPGNMLGYCLVSLHFRCDILAPIPVM